MKVLLKVSYVALVQILADRGLLVEWAVGGQGWLEG